MADVNSPAAQILLGMMANLLCLLATGVVGVALISPWAAGRLRRPLRRFFGLYGDRKRIRVQIKLSNINVMPKGTVSVTPITFGFDGSTITESEYFHALKVAATINSRPLHRALRTLAQENGLIAEPPVVCDIGVSPGYWDVPGVGDATQHVDNAWQEKLRDSIEAMFEHGGTFILVGSPVYNALVEHVLREFPESRFAFTRPREGFHPTGEERYGRAVTFHGRRGDPLVRTEHLDEPPPYYVDYFVIQKFVRTTPNRLTVFVCAGQSAAATVAALNTLVDWRTLRKQFGDDPFAAVYELKTSKLTLTSQDFEHPLEVWEIVQRHHERTT